MAAHELNEPRVWYATPEEEAVLRPLFDKTRAANAYLAEHSWDLAELYDEHWVAIGSDGVRAADKDPNRLWEIVQQSERSSDDVIYHYFGPRDIYQILQMEIRGRFIHGRPTLIGQFLFPNHDLATANIEFVVDTGAAVSLLAPSPSWLAVMNYEEFDDSPLISLSGLAERVAARYVTGILGLESIDGRLVNISTRVAIPDPARPVNLPSLLGQDLLDRFHLTIDRSINLVRLSDPRADIHEDRWPDGGRR